MNTVRIIILFMLVSTYSCSVTNSNASSTKPDFGKTNTSLRFDNREQYQDKWQTYLNSCSGTLLAQAVTYAEKERKRILDMENLPPEERRRLKLLGMTETFPLHDRLLSHTSEITAKIVPVYTISEDNFLQYTDETAFSDAARLDTCRMSCYFMLDGEIIGAYMFKDNGLRLWPEYVYDSSVFFTYGNMNEKEPSDHSEGQYLASLFEQGKEIFTLVTIGGTESIWIRDWDTCFTQEDKIMHGVWTSPGKKMKTVDMQETLSARAAEARSKIGLL